MPPRPRQPLRIAAASKLLAIHQPAESAALGAEAQALAVGRNVRVQRNDSAGGPCGDARLRFGFPGGVYACSLPAQQPLTIDKYCYRYLTKLWRKELRLRSMFGTNVGSG